MVSIDLLETLCAAWQSICHAHEVTAELPDMQALFAGVDLSESARAAELVVTNMLAEAMEHIGRFSPWYRKPVGAFGLTLAQHPLTHRTQWTLTGEAVCQWQVVLSELAVAIERNQALILSASVLDSLPGADDDCVMARCLCTPPRVILVTRAVLGCAQIRCDTCQQAFELIEEELDPPNWDS